MFSQRYWVLIYHLVVNLVESFEVYASYVLLLLLFNAPLNVLGFWSPDVKCQLSGCHHKATEPSPVFGCCEFAPKAKKITLIPLLMETPQHYFLDSYLLMTPHKMSAEMQSRNWSGLVSKCSSLLSGCQ